MLRLLVHFAKASCRSIKLKSFTAKPARTQIDPCASGALYFTVVEPVDSSFNLIDVLGIIPHQLVLLAEHLLIRHKLSPCSLLGHLLSVLLLLLFPI